MRPIVIPVEWKRYVEPRRLSSPDLGKEVMWPDGSIIPHSLHIRADEKAQRVELACRYPPLKGPREHAHDVRGGRIVLFERSGLLCRLQLEPAAMRPETYDGFGRLLQVFLAYARTSPLGGGRPWSTLFSAEIMLEHWKKEEDVLRAVFGAAPYR